MTLYTGLALCESILVCVVEGWLWVCTCICVCPYRGMEIGTFASLYIYTEGQPEVSRKNRVSWLLEGVGESHRSQPENRKKRRNLPLAQEDRDAEDCQLEETWAEKKQRSWGGD